MKVPKKSEKKEKQTAGVKKPSNKLELSVIIPAHNLEKEIGRCLKSVLAQKNVEMEVIVVDDGSQDATLEKIQEWAVKDERIKCISFPENLGVSAARNVGLNVAKGEFVHFCDGDDAVTENAYEELLRIAQKTDADLVTGNYSRMYPNEKKAVRPFSHYEAPTGKERCFESGNTTLWNKIFRRSLIEKSKLRFEEDMVCMEDLLFYNLFLLEDPVISYTDYSVYIYTEPIVRQSGGKIRFADLNCAKGFYKTWQTTFAVGIKEDADLWREAFRWNLSWYFNYSWKMIQDSQERLEAFIMLKDLLKYLECEIQFDNDVRISEFPGIAEILHMDIYSFFSITFEDYLLHLAAQNHVVPHTPMAIEEDITGLSSGERDKYLAEIIQRQLNEIREMCQKTYANEYVWGNHYWNLFDCLMNDYWRRIMDPDIKESLFIQIRQTVEQLRIEKEMCSITSVERLGQFCKVFCVDNVTLQKLSMSQYLTVCAVVPSGGWIANISPQSVPAIPAFLDACRNGQVGMRAILKAIKSWVQYKCRRKR